MKSIELYCGHSSQPSVHKYRIDLVRAGIVGASFYMSDPEVLLYPFLDYLYLLFQPAPPDDPLAFLVWQDNKCVFSSFSDAYYCDKYALTPELLAPPSHGVPIASGVMLTVHRIRSKYLLQLEENGLPSGFTQSSLLDPDYYLMGQVHQLLHADHEASASWLGLGASEVTRKLQLIAEALIHGRPNQPTAEKLSTCDNLTYREDVLPLLEPVREILDDVFQEARESELSYMGRAEPPLGNVFCAVRTACNSGLRFGAFPYSAGLLLSTSQKFALLDWCINPGRACLEPGRSGQECIEDLEMPLGQRSRSVADVTFCSGIIDFARKASDEVWDKSDLASEADANRLRVEQCIYPSPASLYYVPVHVQGLPWIAAFTFTPSDPGHESTRWLHNYIFYRDIMQRAAALLRLRVEHEYVRLASTAAAEAIVSWQKPRQQVTDELNAEWHRLARVFPFPALCAAHNPQSGTLEIDLETGVLDSGDQGTWSLTAEDNPYFGTPHVHYRQVRARDMTQRVGDAARAQLATRRNISLQESSRALAYSSHILNTPLNALYAAVGESKDQENRTRVRKDVRELKSLAEFAMTAVDARRRRRIEWKDVSGRALAAQITSELRKIIGLLSDRRIAGSAVEARKAKAIRDMLPNKVAIDLDLETMYRYCPQQLTVVVQEVVKNAVRYAAEVDLAITIAVTEPSQSESHGVYLRVGNSVQLPFEAAKQEAQRNTSGPADLLGVMTLRKCCDACGYGSPQWEAIESDANLSIVQATVRIADLVTEKAHDDI